MEFGSLYDEDVEDTDIKLGYPCKSNARLHRATLGSTVQRFVVQVTFLDYSLAFPPCHSLSCRTVSLKPEATLKILFASHSETQKMREPSKTPKALQLINEQRDGQCIGGTINSLNLTTGEYQLLGFMIPL